MRRWSPPPEPATGGRSPHRISGATLDSALLILLAVVLVVALGAGIAFLLRTGQCRPLDARRPRGRLGSPAQVWLEHGERVCSEVGARIASLPAFSAVLTETDHVVTELSRTADRVAALNRLLDAVDLDQLGAEHEQLRRQEGAASGEAAHNLRTARNDVAERLRLAQRRVTARDMLLARMKATVDDLEQCRDEVDELVDGALGPDSPDPTLVQRLTALRIGIAEVTELPEIRQLSDPG